MKTIKYIWNGKNQVYEIFQEGAMTHCQDVYKRIWNI